MESADDLDALLRRPRRAAATDALQRWLGAKPVLLGAVAAVVVIGLGVATVALRSGDADPVTLLPQASPGSAQVSSSTVAAGSGATSPGAGQAAGATSTSVPTEIVVHVAGAVNAPGVVRVGPNARVTDAVSAAGGPRGDADLNKINLAALLSDGVWLYVPAVGESTPPVAGGPVASGADASSGTGTAVGHPASGTASGAASAPQPVNINTATAQELETLPGVGPATAAAIIAHRESAGPFTSPEQLDDVRGIGPAKVEALIDAVVVR